LLKKGASERECFRVGVIIGVIRIIRVLRILGIILNKAKILAVFFGDLGFFLYLCRVKERWF
jgi:hypothetical protein